MQEINSMGIEELDSLIAKAQEKRESLVSVRRAELLAELESLGGGGYAGGAEHPNKGVKAEPKFRSKKSTGVTWTGRGAMPKWMRAEIEEGLGKEKADFAI